MSEYLAVGGVRTIENFHRVEPGETLTGQISEVPDGSGMYDIMIEFNGETDRKLITVQ